MRFKRSFIHHRIGQLGVASRASSPGSSPLTGGTWADWKASCQGGTWKSHAARWAADFPACGGASAKPRRVARQRPIAASCLGEAGVTAWGKVTNRSDAVHKAVVFGTLVQKVAKNCFFLTLLICF
eukprot:s1485_g5.t1